MKASASLLLIVGCLWAILVVWLFLTIGGVADEPESWTKIALYWGGLLVGPSVLIISAVLVLRDASSWPGAILVGIGCMIFTGFAFYNSVVGMQRKPLEAPPSYLFYAVLLLIMLLSDFAAFKIYKGLSGSR